MCPSTLHASWLAPDLIVCQMVQAQNSRHRSAVTALARRPVEVVRLYSAATSRLSHCAQHFKRVVTHAMAAMLNIQLACRFEDLLRSITVSRTDICNAMVFALDNAESATEVGQSMYSINR